MHKALKRIFDVLFALLAIVALAPVWIVVAIWIAVTSPGGVFFRQKRTGYNGEDFDLLKFRSMRIGADRQGLITIGGHDSRITRVGYFIRKYKIDELPQLFNVLKGDMSLVGPRPEVRKYTDMYTDEQRRVLSIRPGITDYASIKYADENVILGQADDPDKVYVEQIMPDKIRLNMRYIENHNLREYFKIIFLTIKKII